MNATLWTKSNESRRSFIGGSDARIIMGSDEGALLRLWQQKRGEAAALDYSDNLIVQLGLATEPLNRRWFEKNDGAGHQRRPELGAASSDPLDGSDAGRGRRGHGRGVRGKIRRISVPHPIPQRRRQNRIANNRMGRRRQPNKQPAVMGSFLHFQHGPSSQHSYRQAFAKTCFSK